MLIPRPHVGPSATAFARSPLPFRRRGLTARVVGPLRQASMRRMTTAVTADVSREPVPA
jgi:hypothetical protein